MFDFFKNKKKNDEYNLQIKTAALLINVAKIDENYTENEKKIIKKTLFEFGINNEKIPEVFDKAENIEKIQIKY